MYWLGFALGGMGLCSLTAVVGVSQYENDTNGIKGWQLWWKLFSEEVRKNGGYAWLYNAVIIFLLYSLWLTSQMKGWIIWASWIVQLGLLLIVVLVLMSEAIVRCYFESSRWNLTKIAIGQLFLSPKSNFFTVLWGMIMIMGLLYYPAVSILLGVGSWIIILPKQYEVEWEKVNIL